MRKIHLHQCFSLISTESTSTPSWNQRSAAPILTSFPLICLFLINPLGANVQSSNPYVRHHWPASSRHSYQNCTAICCLDVLVSKCLYESMGVWQQLYRTLSSVNAKSSFRRRYSFSFAHFLVRKSTICSRPWRNVSRFRQMESGV